MRVYRFRWLTQQNVMLRVSKMQGVKSLLPNTSVAEILSLREMFAIPSCSS